MKALSIIGIIFSLLLALLSFAVMQFSCTSYFEGYSNSTSYNIGQEMGLIILVIALFFLAFSIVATVFSFRRKKIIQ